MPEKSSDEIIKTSRRAFSRKGHYKNKLKKNHRRNDIAKRSRRKNA